MKIAVASGKGGTGKTTVSVSLYHFLKESHQTPVQLIDCDVEEPNDVLFFPNINLVEEKKVYQLVPKIDTEKCTFCKKCSDWCEFNAITIIKNRRFAKVNSDLCHSCGACSIACEFEAITEYPQPLGVISTFTSNQNDFVTEGRLEIGSAMQTSLIKEVKKHRLKNTVTQIFDAPPGTSCPVVETVSDADFIILVSEPTPFGLHDLKLAVDTMRELGKPFGVIINREGVGNSNVEDYCREEGIPLLAKIPNSRDIAERYSKGKLLYPEVPEVLEALIQIKQFLTDFEKEAKH